MRTQQMEPLSEKMIWLAREDARASRPMIRPTIRALTRMNVIEPQ